MTAKLHSINPPSGIYAAKGHLTGDESWTGPPEVSQSLAVSHLVPYRRGSTRSRGLPVTERADPAMPPLQHFDLTGGKMSPDFHTDLSCCYLSLS